MDIEKNMDDWPTTVSKFDRIFRAIITHERMNLRGINFATQEHLGKIKVRGDLVEITTGIGFRGGRIFGVTFNRLPPFDLGGVPDPRDTMCDTLEEVNQYLAKRRCRKCGEAMSGTDGPHKLGHGPVCSSPNDPYHTTGLPDPW